MVCKKMYPMVGWNRKIHSNCFQAITDRAFLQPRNSCLGFNFICLHGYMSDSSRREGKSSRCVKLIPDSWIIIPKANITFYKNPPCCR